MAIKPMYPAIVNSPGTEISTNITATDTSVTVVNVATIPAAPNLLTIGSDETAETVRYTAISGSTLTVERGFQGIAKAWSAGTKVARYFTAYDHDTFRENITSHNDDASVHVTTAKKAEWDAKETPNGAQAKADTALAAAKNDATAKANQAEANAKAASLQISGGAMLGPLGLAGANGVNAFNRGTGDGASYQNHNITLKGWYGMGMSTYDDGVHGVYDFRAGRWVTKSGYSVTDAAGTQHMSIDSSGNITTNGTVIVGGVDLKQSGVDAKNGVVASLNAMGVTATTADDWATLAAKIRQITTGKKYAVVDVAVSNAYWPVSITMPALGFIPTEIHTRAGIYSYNRSSHAVLSTIGDSGYFRSHNGADIWMNLTHNSATNQLTFNTNGTVNLEGTTVRLICYE
ncbi:hypothetical protein NQ117_05225 [Paenibacillus sp. SC116]|uniref:hypothetical protein n=1 Tax=Paenibacillus sp. SC116 TaxID=2968986 RepID=UPI00215A234D|nr:hypothetical protein [Paenibacillus sp. SC116]MCR8843073.1 hypothetical protein [Paenibacillus sp. SC116]